MSTLAKIDIKNNFQNTADFQYTGQDLIYNQIDTPEIFKNSENSLVPKNVCDFLEKYAPRNNENSHISAFSLTNLPKVHDPKFNQMINELEKELSSNTNENNIQISPVNIQHDNSLDSISSPNKNILLSKTHYKYSQFGPELYESLYGKNGFAIRKKREKRPNLLEKFKAEVEEIRKNEIENLAQLKQRIDKEITLGYFLLI